MPSLQVLWHVPLITTYHSTKINNNNATIPAALRAKVARKTHDQLWDKTDCFFSGFGARRAASCIPKRLKMGNSRMNIWRHLGELLFYNWNVEFCRKTVKYCTSFYVWAAPQSEVRCSVQRKHTAVEAFQFLGKLIYSKKAFDFSWADIWCLCHCRFHLLFLHLQRHLKTSSLSKFSSSNLFVEKGGGKKKKRWGLCEQPSCWM